LASISFVAGAAALAPDPASSIVVAMTIGLLLFWPSYA
jgi:hypothetical protein